VANLLAQREDFANIGQSEVSLVDSDSFWVDAYFEENQLGSIREGDAAIIPLMGYRQVVRGHVGGIHVCIDDVPRNVRLVAGITAPVRIASP
jgi:multidrug resistance efflux pump